MTAFAVTACCGEQLEPCNAVPHAPRGAAARCWKCGDFFTQDGARLGQKAANDPVNNPAHYTSHPSGVECVDIAEHYGFNLGNAMKYIWRAGIKSKSPVEDLKKAAWYVAREIARLEKGAR